MVKWSSFQGKIYYYENINGKEKEFHKLFDDAKKYNDFVKKYSMPKMPDLVESFLSGPSKKALPSKKNTKMACKSCCSAKPAAKKAAPKAKKAPAKKKK